MSTAKIARLVYRAKHATGNHKLALDRLPKGHWMRTDAAKAARRMKYDRIGIYRPGII